MHCRDAGEWRYLVSLFRMETNGTKSATRCPWTGHRRVGCGATWRIAMPLLRRLPLGGENRQAARHAADEHSDGAASQIAFVVRDRRRTFVDVDRRRLERQQRCVVLRPLEE